MKNHIYSAALVADMKTRDAKQFLRQIDALWAEPDEKGDRHPRPETDLLAGVARHAIAERIADAHRKGEIGLKIVLGSPEMLMRPETMNIQTLVYWRALTAHATGLPLRKCAECGALYQPPDRRATLYCSKRCRNAATVRVHRAREKAKREGGE